MSEIKCNICGFIGSSADCVAWEHTCTDIMKDRNKDLERQLSQQESDYNEMLIALKEEHKKELLEARKELRDFSKEYSFEEQLKEQGENE